MLGCFIGLVFHLPMIAQGVADFPVLIVGFYPAFLSLAETRELIRRCLARPTTARLAGALVLGWLGIRVIQRAPKLVGLYGNALGLDPLVMIVNTVLTSATLVALVHVTLVLGAWLLERRLRPTPEAGEAAGREPPYTRSAAWLGRRRPSRRSAPAAAAVLLVGAAFVYNNLGLFFGLPSAGAMIMYSGIANDRSNHLVMPRILVGDSYAYASIVRFEPRAIETREVREFVAALARLDGRNQPYQLNLNFLRYQMNRICRSAPGGTFGLTLRTEEGRMLDFANACAEPTMLWHSVIPIGARCNPACGPVFRDWARGDPRPDSSCPTGPAMGCEPGAAQ